MNSAVNTDVEAVRADPAAVVARYLATLTALASSEDGLRAIVHPLGFLCLPLVRGPRRGVCVHLWTDGLPAVELSTSAIHSHSWDLHSYVLFGRIDNSLIHTATVPADEASHQIYRIESARGRDRIIATSQYVRCEGSETDYATAGEDYRLPAGRFHATLVADGSTAATVLVADTLPGAQDRSLGPVNPPGAAASWHIRRHLATAALSRQAVEAVLDLAPASA